MPIVLDHAADGAIVGGSFYSHVQHHAVQAGIWQVVLPGAIYARLVHFVDDGTPVQGFLREVGEGRMAVAGSSEEGVVQGDGDVAMGTPAPQAIMQAGDDVLPPTLTHSPPDRANRVHSPSPPPARSSKRRRLSPPRTLRVTHPIAAHIEESSGVATLANSANPTSIGKTPRATQIPHVGNVFTHFRAILLRTDYPYICNLCGTGFPHPTDVKAHFRGVQTGNGEGAEKKGCWAEKGRPAGVLWDDHTSCKISEEDLRIERCKEGYVVVDQESWDKINAAAEEGRKFLEAKDADDEVTAEKERKEAGGRGKRAKTATKKATPAESVGKKGLSKKSKVVKAGDETETSTRKGSMVTTKEPPRRKMVKAGDESETDLTPRKK